MFPLYALQPLMHASKSLLHWRIRLFIALGTGTLEIASQLTSPSINGITGERTELPENLPIFINRVRQFTTLPLAVGFGISTRRHFESAGKIADGVVIGSAIIKAVTSTDVSPQAQASRARSYAEQVTGKTA